MFIKLKKKFIILNLLIISIVLFISFFSIYIITYNNVYKEIHSKLEIKQNTGVQNNFNNSIHQQNMNNDINSFNLIVNEENQILQILSYHNYEEEYYSNLLKLTHENNLIEYNNELWMHSKIKANYFFNSNTGAEYIYSYVNVTTELNNLKSLVIELILIWFLMIIIVFYISLYFSSKYIKPIEENYEKQKRFIADASHELKTPIAIISANADALLLSKKDTIEKQKKWITYIKNETTSMSKLVSDLLTLAKSEEVKLNISEYNISQIVEDSIISLEAIAFEKNIKIKKKIEKNIISKTDKEKLKQVIIILIDNAIKYSKEKEVIELKLSKIKKEIIFTISNPSDINETELNKIFERFYKCDQARTNTNSFGLGLSIAKNILKDLNYNIKVSSENKKIKFTIKMK